MAVRSIGTNRRSLTGHVSTDCGGKSLSFESSLERDLYIGLDFNPLVRSVEVQPVIVEYVDGVGRWRKYTPDALVHYRSDQPHFPLQRPMLTEVKYREDLWREWKELRPRFVAARRYASERNWRFKIQTEREIRTPFLENAVFLRPYRTMDIPADLTFPIKEYLRAVGESRPDAVIAATCASTQRRMEAISALWHLLSNRLVGADLSQPLTMHSPIWSIG
jgi:hypothetical protein